uniref:Uncharacterized protein n=1 Tax=Rhizophora mucronata TaxID=61149 RepID=A0A2P2JNL9_RHIMU
MIKTLHKIPRNLINYPYIIFQGTDEIIFIIDIAEFARVSPDAMVMKIWN